MLHLTVDARKLERLCSSPQLTHLTPAAGPAGAMQEARSSIIERRQVPFIYKNFHPVAGVIQEWVPGSLGSVLKLCLRAIVDLFLRFFSFFCLYLSE